MIAQLRSLFRLPTLMLLEGSLIGLFMVQALRFLVGSVYSRTAGASTALTLAAIGQPVPATAPDPAVVQGEIALVFYALLLPLIALLFGRYRVPLVIGAAVAAIGRVLMNLDTPVSATGAAAVAVGGGLLYLAMVARHRAWVLPLMLLIGIGADGVLRAFGNTLDPSWSAVYAQPQIALSILAVLLALVTWLRGPQADAETGGILMFTGGLGLGAFLFLELSFLGIPNAAAARSDSDYTLLVPLITAATLLPIIPAVRSRLRAFIGLFDAGVRGWLWMLVLILLLVLGTRFRGLGAGVALAVAQFGLAALPWWFVRPRAERERSFGGLWVIFGAALFGLLVVMDTFTYEYAYVREFTGNLNFLNSSLAPLLRGFRGLGLAVILVALFFAALPITQMRRRIAWPPAYASSGLASVLAFLVVAAAAAGAGAAARPPVVPATLGIEEMRVGTYNIHGGYSEVYNLSLDGIARTIQESGANVVLVQEAEAGRMTSFGVDQPLWLARRLGMDIRFFPTDEGMQGLAVLSNIPIAYDDGQLLSSLGQQTGVQRVQIVPAPNTVVTLYNTWLGYLLDTSNLTLSEQEQDQVRQLNEIFTVIAAHHPDGRLGRTVFGGTFNNVPDSPLLQTMRAFRLTNSAAFTDPHEGLPIELSATLVRTGVPRVRFDYLWLNNLPSTGAGVIPRDDSDHRLVVASVRLSRDD